MTISIHVYRTARVVPVRVHRAAQAGEVMPHLERPDLDTRGFAQAPHGAVVGVMRGETATVRIARNSLDTSSALFVTSAHPAVVRIEQPAGGRLPNEARMEVVLRGVTGGNPTEARIAIRCGSATGPVLHEFTVWCLSPVWVWIAPHIVRIAGHGAHAAALSPDLDTAHVQQMMERVEAVWRPCGIRFISLDPNTLDAQFANAGVVRDDPWPGDVHRLLSLGRRPNHINLYFVRRIGRARTLGYGFDRQFALRYRVPTGIILAQTDSGGFVREEYDWVNDIAHEVGHFFGLAHVEHRDAAHPRNDGWSLRRLMHPLHPRAAFNDWRDDVGYGPNNRGCLITMKNLPQLRTDGECLAARRTILSPQGPY